MQVGNADTYNDSLGTVTCYWWTHAIVSDKTYHNLVHVQIPRWEGV